MSQHASAQSTDSVRLYELQPEGVRAYQLGRDKLGSVGAPTVPAPAEIRSLIQELISRLPESERRALQLDLRAANMI
jgi:hypothetical protein